MSQSALNAVDERDGKDASGGGYDDVLDESLYRDYDMSDSDWYKAYPDDDMPDTPYVPYIADNLPNGAFEEFNDDDLLAIGVREENGLDVNAGKKEVQAERMNMKEVHEELKSLPVTNLYAQFLAMMENVSSVYA